MQLRDKDFFNIDDYLEDDYPILCVISDRGIGKTHSTTNSIVEKCKESRKKFVITRLTYEVFKKYKDDIKNMCNLTCSLQAQNLSDENGVIGYLASLNTYANAKGGTYNDVEYMIFDEFNEDVYIENAYAKFVMLLDSFKRHRTNFKCILLGNMINKNNWFLNAMGIRANWKNEADEIHYVKEYGVKVVIIGSRTFERLSIARKEINALASADPAAHAFYNEREFLNDESDNVVNFMRWVKPTFTPIYTFRYSEFKYIFGKYVEEDGRLYFFVDRISSFYTPFTKNLPDFGFDLVGNVGSKKTQVLSDEELKQFQEQFFVICKQERLKFGSFDAFEDLQRFISLGTML